MGIEKMKRKTCSRQINNSIHLSPVINRIHKRGDYSQHQKLIIQAKIVSKTI